MKKYNPDEIEGLTVGALRKALDDLPDKTPVYYQRIEDTYFEEGKGWKENELLVPDNDFHEYNDEYIRALCCFQDSRKPRLLITAHY